MKHQAGWAGITWFWVKEIANHIEGLSGEGALFKSLSKKQLKAVPVIRKPEELIKRTGPLFDGFLQKLRQLEIENRTLTQLRNRLLPKLISGEIRVSQLEDAQTPSLTPESMSVK